MLSLEKCHFMVREGMVLGHKISKSGIEVDQAKIEMIEKLLPPDLVRAIRSLLGHTGFYRRFFKDVSKITRLLTKLLEKNSPFYFDKDCLEAFHIMKVKFVHASIMVTPDLNLPFEPKCDCNDHAVGIV